MKRNRREPDEHEKAERERRRFMEAAGSFVIDVESERGQRPASQTAATAEGEATSSFSKTRHIR